MIFNQEYPRLGVDKKSSGKIFEKVTSGLQLKSAIYFVDRVHSKHKRKLYVELYEQIKQQDLLSAPEMLLLQRDIWYIQATTGTIFKDVKKQVHEYCFHIISDIRTGISVKDYSISVYIVESIDSKILNENMEDIVRYFSGSLKSIFQLIEYSINLPHIENNCFLIDALMKELENPERNLSMDSEHAMHIWAHAKYYTLHPNWLKVEANIQKLCTDAINKLSPNKQEFYEIYQKYVEEQYNYHENIRDMHENNPHLESIVSDFVSFYYNGDVVRTQNLFTATRAITKFVAVGRILTQLHEEMHKRKELSSFEAFRLFTEAARRMSFSSFDDLEHPVKNIFEHLKKVCPANIRQLLWDETVSRWILLNKGTDSQLIFTTFNEVIMQMIFPNDMPTGCWNVLIDPLTSLLSFSPRFEGELELENGRAVITFSLEKLMIKAVDERYIQIYNEKGWFFLSYSQTHSEQSLYKPLLTIH